MKNRLLLKRSLPLSFLFAFIFLFYNAHAQPETIRSGSFIVNMGNSNTGSTSDDLKPYGMFYDLMKNYSIPIKWIIAPGKSKDGADFIHNGISYKGGTFIIPAEYRSATINARIAYWQTQGVVGNTSVADFTANVYLTLLSIPRWTLDAQNGQIAEGYLIAAGINNTGPSAGAYNWRAVAALDCCDDFFVMPHADPTWASHNRLYFWNRDCHGSIWAGCHAVSALENCINPANPTQQMNFLSTRTAATTPTPYPNNSLKLWSQHDNGSIPYTHRLFDDPVSQYIGVPDLSMTNGSEQIFIPKQSTDPGGATRWRPLTKILSYDPTQEDVPSPDLSNGNVAVAIAYGPGFGDDNNGLVMYQAGHNNLKNSPGDGPALRAFLNFSFYQAQLKSPQVAVISPVNGQQLTSGNVYNFSANGTSPLPGVTFSYQWSSTCGGAFGSATAASTTFTPAASGLCMVTVKVTDNCGRQSFQTFSINVLPPASPPAAVDDNATISGNCVPRSPAMIDVLANDVPNVSPITFTGLNQGTASPANAGTWTADVNGLVTFTPNVNFNGSATITYTVTNAQGLSSNATITVSVGSVDPNGCSPNSIYMPSEVAFITLDNFISQSGTGSALGELSLDEAEEIYNNDGDDYINFGTNAANHLVLSIGSTSPLRYKDTLNIYWSKGSAGVGTMTVQLGQSSTGPWSNAQTFTNSSGSSGPAGAMISQFVIPNGVSGITHIRISSGTAPATNSSSSVWIDAVEFQYLSCVSKQPDVSDDAMTVLEDAPTTIAVLSNDSDPQGLPIRLTRILTQPANGKVSINLDGTVTYINNTDDPTNTSFSYEVCNSQDYCSTANVVITIAADGCGPLQYRANPPGGSVTKIFSYQYAGTNAAGANPTGTNFSDSKLYQGSSGDNNYGTSNTINVGEAFASNDALRPIFYFNISEIPSFAIIQSANLSLQRTGGDGNAQLVSLFGLTESYIENQVTWLERSTGVSWTNPGGTFGTLISTSNVGTGNIRYYWDAKSQVQSWVNTPANNFGFLLKTDEILNKKHTFATKENGTLSKRPELSVTYAIPDPCSVLPNRAPLAQTDYATTPNGQQVVISPLLNDADVDAGNTFTITGISGITAGSATFTGTTITYTANVSPTVTRTERLTYTITDNNGATDQAYVYISVTNAAPNANADNTTTLSGSAVSVAVLTNDNDPEGGSITAPVITGLPQNGEAIVVGNNIQYTPGPGFTGNDTLIYQICETALSSCNPFVLCDTAILVITVQNRPPVANNDTKTILPCLANTINLINNDTDPENNSLSINSLSALSDPLAGILVNNNDGTVTFTPAMGYGGVVSFTYTIIDNGITPLISAPASVTITVTNPPVNSAPIPLNDVESTNMDHKLYASVLDNDSDPDGQELTNPVITVQPLHGTAIVLGNGLIEYTPNPGFAGSDILTYQICDKVINQSACSSSPELCATATLSITVTGSNTIIGVNDEHSTWVNTVVSGPTLLNDYDLEGNLPLIFRGFIIGGTRYTSGSYTVAGKDATGSPVANAGSLTINADGTYTFTPANNFSGSVIVDYAIDDSSPITATDIASLQITVNPLPGSSNSVIANNDEHTSYGAAVSSNVLTNDRDPQGNTFTVGSYRYDSDGNGTDDSNGTIGAPVIIGGSTTTGVPTTNAGSLTLNADGTYTFTPAVDFSGTAGILYTICDNNATPACATAVLHIEVLEDPVSGDNDLPVAGDDFIYTRFNIPASGSFINNDSDPNSNPLSLNGTTIVPAGPHTLITTAATTNGGTVQFYADGTYTYTPLAGFSGPDDINYTICDVTGISPQPLCKTARIHFLVAPDDTPVAVNDTNTTNEDTPVSGNASSNDTPSNDGGNAWSLVGVNGGATNGTVTMNPDGTYTYTPNANYNGTDVFTYQVCDVDGDCSTATVTITINAVDDVPVAVNDVNTTNEDTPVSGNASPNDTPSGDGGNVWSLVGINGGAANGTVTMNADGTYTYTPNVNYNGTDVFNYQVCDVDGDCSTATVTITINPVDDVPLAVNDVNSTNEDTPVSGNVSSNDTPSGDGGNTWTLVGINGGATNGTVTMNPDGTYTYTPNANYNGTDVFTYQVCDVDGDCSTATVTITINPVDDVPVAVNDVNTTNEDTPVSGNASSNDTSSGDGGNVWSLVGPNGGATNGTVTMNTDGTYTYTPNANYNGTDVFTYQVCDVDGDCSTATVTITINPADDVPVAVNDVNTTNEDTPVSGNASTNDTPSPDGGNIWSLIGVNGGAANGTVTMNTDGTYTYTPNANYNGTDVFTYQVCDIDGDCSTATVTININPGDDVPVALNDVNTTNEDTPVSGNASTNDTPSPDGGNTWSLIGVNGGASNGTVTMNPDGTYTYTPNANYNGTDVFTYQVCDVDGDCSTATVTITINPVDEMPIAVNDVNTTNEDTPVSGNASSNDTPSPDGGNIWTLIGINGGAANGTVTMNTNGTYTYTPNANYSGTDVFNYQVCDVDGDCSTATVTITINPVNDVPVAVNDANTTNEDTPVSGNASTNDTPSGDGGNTWVLIGANGGASHGTVTMNTDGTYTYTPNTNYNGVDAFLYSVCDINGDCSSAIVTITILPVPDTPIGVNDENSTWQTVNVSGSVITNDLNIINDNQTFNSYLHPSSLIVIGSGSVVSGINKSGNSIINAGTLTFDANGNYTFSPAANFAGLVTIPYRLCNGSGTPVCDTAFLAITVDVLTTTANSVIANNDENVSYGNPVSNTVFANDKDPQFQSFMLTGIAGGTPGVAFNVPGADQAGNPVSNAGLLVLNTNGTYTYTPAASFTGSIDVRYTITDMGGATSSAILHIEVLANLNGPANDPPVAGDDFSYTGINSPVSGNFYTNDGDANGNAVQLNGITINPAGPHTPIGSAVLTNQGGAVQYYTDGTFVYTPPSNYTGPDYINYTICDVSSVMPYPLCASAQIHFLVGPSFTTLPVTAIRATASLQNNTATVRWETENEFNSSYFEVERSIDNINFYSTGTKVNAAGNSTVPKQYELDNNIQSVSQYAVIYYRVKLTGIDGQVKYSNVVQVRLTKNQDIKAWPNPFSSFITMNITLSQNTSLTIRLTDMSGKTVRTYNQSALRGITQVTLTDLDKLANGVYMIEVTEEVSGRKSIMKFVKER